MWAYITLAAQKQEGGVSAELRDPHSCSQGCVQGKELRARRREDWEERDFGTRVQIPLFASESEEQFSWK